MIHSRLTFGSLALVLVAQVVGCSCGNGWSEVESGSELFSFEYPEAWQAPEGPVQGAVSYFEPETGTEFTVSGYFGVSDPTTATNAIFSAVVGREPRASEWHLGSQSGADSYSYRHEGPDKITDILVLFENQRVVVATMIASQEAAAANASTYERMLASVELNSSAEPMAGLD